MAHYYTREGELVAQVQRAKGDGMRDTTLADARKLGLLPSVTTVISLMDKPQLNNWRVQQAALKAVELHDKGWPVDDVVAEIVRQSEEYMEWASAFGTEVHKGLEHRLQDRAHISMMMGTGEVVDAFWPWYNEQGFTCERSELSFASPDGYGGTIDFLGYCQAIVPYCGTARVLADFKTQDFDNIKDAKFYEEHPIQLAGYACGIGEPDIPRMSIILSRTTPGLVAPKLWTNNAKDIATWQQLWGLWKLVKNWDLKGEI